MKHPIVKLDQPLDEFPIKSYSDVTTRFYFLFRRDHLTPRYFGKSVSALSAKLAIQDWNTPGEFLDLIEWTFGYNFISQNWLIKHWSHFNPNINRRIKVSWKEQRNANQKMSNRTKLI